MAGASIEATLELWASSLRDVKTRMRALFTQARVANSASQFLDRLLGEERRKTGWMRAEAAGDPGPWRQQAILGRGQWDADELRDIVGGYPRLVDGDRRAPPEDVGGLPGFEDFLTAMAKPRHAQHREVVDWYGGRFEPDDIGVYTINERMAKIARRRTLGKVGFAKSQNKHH